MSICSPLFSIPQSGGGSQNIIIIKTEIHTIYFTGKSANNNTNGHDASKPEKFDQVEDALEAMFGLDEGSGRNLISYDLIFSNLKNPLAFIAHCN